MYFLIDNLNKANSLFNDLDDKNKIRFISVDLDLITKDTKDIESIKTVSFYLENRPKLVDVGAEPKIIIDGKAQPTGVVKT